MTGKRKPVVRKIDPDNMTISQFQRAVNAADQYTRRIYLYDQLAVPRGIPSYIAIFRNMFKPAQILSLFGPGRYRACLSPYPGERPRGTVSFYCHEAMKKNTSL